MDARADNLCLPNLCPQERFGGFAASEHTNPLRLPHVDGVSRAAGEIKRHAARKGAAVVYDHSDRFSIAWIPQGSIYPFIRLLADILSAFSLAPIYWFLEGS